MLLVCCQKSVQFYSHIELENTSAIQCNNNYEIGTETCNCLLAVLWMFDGSFPTGNRKTIHHNIETVCMAYVESDTMGNQSLCLLYKPQWFYATQEFM